MRIWFVNHYALPPGSTGGPTRHLGLARALRDRGHHVTIVASVYDHYARRDHRPRSDTWWQVEDIDGVTYVWIDTPPYASASRRVLNMATFAWRVARLGRALPLEAPDIVIGSSPHLLTPLAAKRLARRVEARFVTEVRDIWPQSLVDLGDLSRRHPLIVALSALERHLYRTSDDVITVLPHAGEHFLAHGAHADRLHVIPNGVDLSEEPPERVAHDGFVAVYTGTMGLANGLDVAVDAAEILHERGRDDITIRLIGGGPEHDVLAGRARGLPNITVEPAIPAEDVPGVLASADAGLLILRDSPVFRWGISPTKLFDYMAAGLPVIVSVRSPGDPASDAGASIQAEPGDPVSLADALTDLADSGSSVRDEMGSRGRAVVSEHSFAALSETFLTALRRPDGRDPSRCRGGVAYVVASYPHGTGEPFVKSEVQSLADLGVDVLLTPVHPRGSLRTKADLPVGVEIEVESVLGPQVLAAALLAFLRRPLATVRSVSVLLSRQPLRVVVRNLAVVPKGLWLGRLLRRRGVKHVHSYWASTPATVGMLAAEHAGIPWSLTAHRWDLLEPNALVQKVTSASFARITSAEGVSRAQRQLGDALSGKLVLEYTGIDVPPTLADVTSQRRLRVLCPALLIERKDHQTLLRAVRSAVDGGADVELALAGSGPLLGRLQELASDLDIEDRVRFLGQLGHAQLLQMYEDGCVDVVALTSLDEGLPFGLLEAMARGVPVIGTDVGGVSELISSGGGVLVPAGDVDSLARALRDLVDPTLRRATAQAARRTVEMRFNATTQGERMAELFRQQGRVR